MKVIALIFLTIILSSCANDHSINGNIYNHNKQPIDSVKVLVTGTDIYTFSNKDGYFEIDTNGLNDELLFDKDGFMLKFEKLPENTDDLNVYLSQK